MRLFLRYVLVIWFVSSLLLRQVPVYTSTVSPTTYSMSTPAQFNTYESATSSALNTYATTSSPAQVCVRQHLHMALRVRICGGNQRLVHDLSSHSVLLRSSYCIRIVGNTISFLHEYSLSHPDCSLLLRPRTQRPSLIMTSLSPPTRTQPTRPRTKLLALIKGHTRTTPICLSVRSVSFCSSAVSV